MCFSKEVSFIMSGALGLASAISIGVVSKRRQWRFFLFACIPLFFAIQQFTEGMVWWSIEQHHTVSQQIFSRMYLFFALTFWPFWIPFSLLFIERNRRSLFALLSLYGAAVGIGLFLLQGDATTVSVVERSLQYTEHYPFPYYVGVLFYLSTTVGSAYLSSCTSIKWLAIGFFIFAVISYLLNQYAFISLWCFFSAILSILIIGILFRETRLSI